jgi:hypothetical protein
MRFFGADTAPPPMPKPVPSPEAQARQQAQLDEYKQLVQQAHAKFPGYARILIDHKADAVYAVGIPSDALSSGVPFKDCLPFSDLSDGFTGCAIQSKMVELCRAKTLEELKAILNSSSSLFGWLLPVVALGAIAWLIFRKPGERDAVL